MAAWDAGMFPSMCVAAIGSSAALTEIVVIECLLAKCICLFSISGTRFKSTLQTSAELCVTINIAYQ